MVASLAVHKLLSLTYPLSFALITGVCVLPKKPLPMLISESAFPMFTSSSFIEMGSILSSGKWVRLD